MTDVSPKAHDAIAKASAYWMRVGPDLLAACKSARTWMKATSERNSAAYLQTRRKIEDALAKAEES